MRREWIEIHDEWVCAETQATSPSMRREWIEMPVRPLSRIRCAVSLHAEGVDWNDFIVENNIVEYASPSMRREWIEIPDRRYSLHNADSLPPCGGSGLKWFHRSFRRFLNVSLHAEGVDWNICPDTYEDDDSSLPPCGGSGLKCLLNIQNILRLLCLPPCGGSGLKFLYCLPVDFFYMSPSMRREWIEIHMLWNLRRNDTSPSMRREWIEIYLDSLSVGTISVSLHAEGVDWNKEVPLGTYEVAMSPSMRREWIEMDQNHARWGWDYVSLHAEGVDWNVVS